MQFYISLLGLLVSFLVLINIKTHNRANYYLVLFLVLINLFVLMNYATMLSHNKYLAAIFMVHFMPLIALTGPSIYLYVRSILSDDASLKKIDLLHLVIPVIYFINTFRFDFLIPWNDKLILGEKIVNESRNYVLQFQPVLFSGEIAYMIRQGTAIFYAIACTIMVYRHFKKDFRAHLQNDLIFRWLLILLTFNYVMNFSILYYAVKMIYYWKYFNGLSVFLVGTYYFAIGSVTLINLTLFFFPSILYGLPRMDYLLPKPHLTTKETALSAEDQIPEVQSSEKEYEISIDKLKLIQLKVEEYSLNKPYLNPKFTIALMSSEVGIPVHHLSYFFNEFLHTDFSAWKNNSRIDFVVELIKEGSSNYLTLDALSKQAGFVSRSTFVNAFKQKMGSTPSEFINSL